jgi:hypothetical protein
VPSGPGLSTPDRLSKNSGLIPGSAGDEESALRSLSIPHDGRFLASLGMTREILAAADL